MKITCKTCGKEFEKKNKQKYCCLSCAYKDRTPSRYVIKTCAACNKEFKTKKDTAKYCSALCRVNSQKTGAVVTCCVCGGSMYKTKYCIENTKRYFHSACLKLQRVEKICEHCNKKFLVKPSNMSQKYCSRKCHKKDNDAKRNRVCTGCGAEFKAANPSSIAKWCSKECYRKYRDLNYYTTKKCKNCGKEFKVTHFGYRHRTYCSLECSNGNEQKIIGVSFVNLNKMKRGPVSQTELMLKDILEPLGFIQQYRKAGTFIDYANPEIKLAIFVDGELWHGRTKLSEKKKAIFGKKIEKTILKDKLVNSTLRKDGWAVVRIWDTYLRSHFDECVSDVKSYVDFIVRIRDSRYRVKTRNYAGPGRTFPCNDCRHITAAKRLIGRAKVSESTKAKILACVSRKAKALGCGGNSDCLNDEQFEELIATEEFEDTHEFIEWLEYLDEEAYQYEEEQKAHELAKKARLVK